MPAPIHSSPGVPEMLDRDREHGGQRGRGDRRWAVSVTVSFHVIARNR